MPFWPILPAHLPQEKLHWTVHNLTLRELQKRVDFPVLTLGKGYKLTQCQLTWIPFLNSTMPPARKAIHLRYVTSSGARLDVIELKHRQKEVGENVGEAISGGYFPFSAEVFSLGIYCQSRGIRGNTDVGIMSSMKDKPAFTLAYKDLKLKEWRL